MRKAKYHGTIRTIRMYYPNNYRFINVMTRVTRTTITDYQNASSFQWARLSLEGLYLRACFQDLYIAYAIKLDTIYKHEAPKIHSKNHKSTSMQRIKSRQNKERCNFLTTI